MRWPATLEAVFLLLALSGAEASSGQDRVPASGTEARSNHDWLLACVVSYPMESTPVVLGKVTPQNAQEIARRTAEECDARLASADGRARLSEIKIGEELLESARLYPAAAHLKWLTGCIQEMATVQPGAGRPRLEQHLRGEGGISWPGHKSFYHRECKYLQVGIDFEGAVVTAIEPVELDLIRTD